MAVATDANPGMNFAKIIDAGPKRAKIVSVCVTHVSGDSDTRHNVRSTRIPYRRPVRYQNVSATSAATTPTASTVAVDPGDTASAAPATISVG